MNTYTHQTAPTHYVQANGIRFAYRRFGKEGDVPLVFNMHFMGTMDHWDPAVTDGFAKEREVILFDNAGVSSSSAMFRAPSRRWAPTRLPSSRRSGLSRLTYWAFRSVVLSRKKSRYRLPTSSAAWCWSAPDRGAAIAWIRVRRKADRSSAGTMSIRTIFGFAFTSRRRQRAKRPDTDFSCDFGFAPRIAIPK